MAVTVLLPPDEDDGTCPVRSILDRVGDRWTALVISNLAAGPLRFTELKRRVKGISQRMLTETLRGLERDGMVTRTLYPTIPPRVDYALRPLGESLLEPVQALVRWSVAHRQEIGVARQLYDTRDRDRLKPSGIANG